MKKHSTSYRVRRAISAVMTVIMVVGSIQISNTTIVNSAAEEVAGQSVEATSVQEELNMETASGENEHDALPEGVTQPENNAAEGSCAVAPEAGNEHGNSSLQSSATDASTSIISEPAASSSCSSSDAAISASSAYFSSDAAISASSAYSSSDAAISASSASTGISVEIPDPDEEIVLTTEAGGKYKVTLTGTRQAFGSAVSASASIIPDEEAQEIADKDASIPDNTEVVAAIDISLKDSEGSEVEPEGTINVGIDSILEETEASEEDLSLYHVKDDATSESLDISTEENTDLGISENGVGFATDSFSKFILVKLVKKASPVTITGSITLAADYWTVKDINNDTTNQNAIQFKIIQGGNPVFSTSGSSITWKKNTSDTSIWIYTISGSMDIDASKPVSMEIVSQSPANFTYVLDDNTTTAIAGTLSAQSGKYAFTPDVSGKKVQARTNKLNVKQNSVSGKAFKYGIKLASPYDDKIMQNATIAAAATEAVWDIPAGVAYTVAPVEDADYTVSPASLSGTVKADDKSEVTFKRLMALSPSIDVQWEDNNNYNKNRPDKSKVTMKLQYKTTDGSFHDWADGFAAAEPGPEINTKASVTNWTYKYTKLPSETDNGTAITDYRLSESLESSVPYMHIYAADGKTIINQETFDFSGAVKWNDVSALSENSKKPRPSVSDSNFGITVTAQTSGAGSQYNPATDITSLVSFKWDETSLSTNKYKFTVNLPIYDTSGNPVTYYCTPVKVSNNQQYTDDGGAGSYGAPVCDNGQGAYGNVKDKCYDNGIISYVFADTATISGTKIWVDGNADESTRPAATLYLYRYTQKGSNSFANGSPAQYSDYQSGDPFITQKVPAAGGSFTFPDSAAVAAGKALPKYDIDGNKYIYYVEEKFDSDDKGYNQACTNAGAGDLGNYEGVVMLDGGTITNSTGSMASIEVEKKWTAVADQSAVDAVHIYIGLIRKTTQSTSYEIVTRSGTDIPYVKEYTGFTRDNPYINDMFYYMPLADDNGYKYTYAVYECTADEKGYYDASNIAFAVPAKDADYTISNISALGKAGADAKVNDTIIKIGNIEYVASAKTVEKNSMGSYYTELDNKPAGKLNYIVNKKWSGDGDHKTDANYRPEIKYTIWQKNYNGQVNALYTNESLKALNYVTDGGNIWSSVYENGIQRRVDGNVDSYHLERYDADGHEYTYYVTETSLHPGYYETPAAYTYDAANDTYTCTLNNNWGVGTGYKYVPVEKTWLDGGSVSSRKPVTVALYKKNSAGIIINEDDTTVPTITLDASNGWQGYIAYNPTEYALAAGESFTVRETSVGTGGNKVSVDYSSDGDNNILTGDFTIQGAAKSSDEKYEVVISNIGEKWKIVNKKSDTVGYVTFKEWMDNGTLSGRSRIRLILKRNDADYAYYEQIDTSGYGDKNNFTAAVSGNGYSNDTAAVNCYSKNPSKMIFYNFGSSLPKYDEYGAPYTYTVSEKLYNGSNWVSPADAGYKSMSMDSGYMSSFNFGADNISYSNLYMTDIINLKSGTSVNPVFYKKWIDNNNSDNTRCDIYLTLWRKIDKGSNDKDIIEQVPGYVQRTWSKALTASEQKFADWKVTFDDLPSSVDDSIIHEGVDESYLGHDIHYFVTENMNLDNDYITSYYTGGTESDKYYEKDTYKTTESSGIYVATQNAYATPVNGVIVNRLQNEMTLKGTKVWYNMPSGTHEAVVEDNSIKFTLQYKLSAAETAKDYKYDTADGSLVEKDTGANSVFASLTKTGSGYEYMFTSDGSYDESKILKLPKYNNAGKKYIYSVREEFANSNPKRNNLLTLMYPNPETSLTLDFKTTNTYTASANKTKKINVFKYWNTTKWSEEGDAGNSVYPSVTYTLYRGDPGTEKYYDGNLPPAGKYEMVGRITKTGKEIKEALESNPANNKIYTWDNLPEYAANGKEYVYFVEEKKISGYIVYSKIGKNSPDEKPTNQFNVVQVENDSARQNFNVAFRNCYTGVSSSYVTIEGQKNWYDSDGKTAYSKNKEWLPKLSQLSLKLQRSISGTNGSWTDVSCDIVCDDVNNTFKVCKKGSTTEKLKLHQFNSSGAAYSYRIVEPAPSDWTDYATHKIWQSFNGNKEFIVKLRADKANNQRVLKFTMDNTFGGDYSITKKWNDNMNNDGFRPTSVVFKLEYTITETAGKADWSQANVHDCTPEMIGCDSYNGTADYNGSGVDLTGKVVMRIAPENSGANKTSGWNTVKFSSLPQYDANGNKIHYRAEEVITDKYAVTNQKAESYYYEMEDWKYSDSSTTLFNSMDSTQASVQKIWNDDNDKYNTRPASLTVYLQRTDKTGFQKDAEGVIKTSEADMDWKYVKTVTETDGISRTISAADSWSETVNYLPGVSPEGKTYTYRFTEIPPSGKAAMGSYKREKQTDKILSDGFKTSITNTISSVSEPDVRSLTIEKSWDNAGYLYKPQNIRVELKYSKYTGKNSEYTWASYSPKITAELNEGGNWKYIWDKLPKTDLYGNSFIYKAVELDNSGKEIEGGSLWKNAVLSDNSIRDYKTTYEYDTTEAFDSPAAAPEVNSIYEKISNSLSIVSLTGTKVWTDDNGADNDKRPEIELTVYSDISGNKTALNPQPVITWKKAGNTWTYSIDNLPKYQNDGGLITYSIMEADIKGYTAAGGAADGTCTYSVTCNDTDQISELTIPVFNNTLDRVQITGTKTWTDASDSAKYRPSNADDLTIEIYRKAEGVSNWPEKPQYRLSSRTGMTQSGPAKLIWDYSNDGSGTWSYKVTGLPAYTYKSAKQSEADKWTYGVKELIGDIPYTAQNNDIITVSSDKADLTNTIMKLGTLRISKALDMNGKADPNPMPSFDFIVKMQKNGYSAQLYNGAATLYSSKDNTKVKDLTISDGKIRMRAGEYAVLTGLPYGYTYSAEEIENPDDDYTEQYSTGKSGTISGSESFAKFISRQVEPTKPTEPTKPIEPTKPGSGDSDESKTAVTAEPANTTEPAKPTEPSKTTEQTRTTETTKTGKAIPAKASTAASSGSSAGSSEEIMPGISSSDIATDSKNKKVYYDVNGKRVTSSFPGALFNADGKQVRGAKRGHAINGDWLPGHGPLTVDLSDPGLWAGILVAILAGLVGYLLLRFRKKK